MEIKIEVTKKDGTKIVKIAQSEEGHKCLKNYE